MTPIERRLLRGVAMALLDMRRAMMREGVTIPLARGPDDVRLRMLVAALDGEQRGFPSFASVQTTRLEDETLFVCMVPDVTDGRDLVGQLVLIDGNLERVIRIDQSQQRAGLFCLAVENR
jgi:hypothetical protein